MTAVETTCETLCRPSELRRQKKNGLNRRQMRRCSFRPDSFNPPRTAASSNRSFQFTFRHQNSVCIFVIPHSFNMVRPPHPSSFDHPNDIWCGATVINIIIIIINYTYLAARTLKMETMKPVETPETISEIIKGNILEVSRIHGILFTLTPYFGLHEKRGNFMTS